MVDVIQLLEKLVSYDTRTNKNSPGKEVKKLIENELQPIFKNFGFDTELFKSNNHYSLFASKEGINPIVLFSGHLDVVPWDERWDSDPLTMIRAEENGVEIVRGRGVSDMKSGLAALLIALPKIAQSPLGLQFALTGDEEIGGENGTKIIVDHLASRGLLPNYVITADASGMEIITRRRNVFDLFVNVKKSPKPVVGRKESKTFYSKIISSPTSHAAYFKQNIDFHCVKLAYQFLKDGGYLPSVISGNFVKVNVIPNELTLEYIIPEDEGDELLYDAGLMALLEFSSKLMDISFESTAHSDYGINSTSNVFHDLETQWRLEHDIRAMLDHEANELEGAILLLRDSINYELKIELIKSIGFIATPDNSPLVSSTTAILKKMGYNGKSAERGGATDGRFFAQHDIDTIDIGAIGWNVHGPNETATVQSIKDLVEFFEKSVFEIAKYANSP